MLNFLCVYLCVCTGSTSMMQYHNQLECSHTNKMAFLAVTKILLMFVGRQQNKAIYTSGFVY